MSDDSRPQVTGRTGAVLTLILLSAFVLWMSGGGVSSHPRGIPSKFIQFIAEDSTQGQLQTAIVNYAREDSARVSLIAVVHVGDASYYSLLEKLFATYDAVLYEMIKPKDADPSRLQDSGSALSGFQRLLRNALALEFQLDAIDYSKPNFVHADLDPETFFRMQEERGESLATMMLRAMMHQWKLMAQGEGSQLNNLQLIMAAMSDDSASAMKYLFAKEFHQIEKMVAGLEGPDGSVLLQGRNVKAIEVLEAELGKGKTNLAVFYGAAHMTDMEERLWQLGFKKVDETWLVAWDIQKAPTKKPGGFHIPWFSGSKKAGEER